MGAMLTLKYVSGYDDYSKKIFSLIKKSKQKVCYITLNKSALAMRDALKKQKMDPNRFFFIDGISAIIKTPKPLKNCEFIAEPTDLKAIGSATRKAIKEGYTLVVFDSLSTLLSYGHAIPAGAGIITGFVKDLMPTIEENNGSFLFICNERDKEKLLIEETLPIFEKIIRP